MNSFSPAQGADTFLISLNIQVMLAAMNRPPYMLVDLDW